MGRFPTFHNSTTGWLLAAVGCKLPDIQKLLLLSTDSVSGGHVMHGLEPDS